MEMQLRCITTSQDIGRDGGFGYIPAESKHGNLNASSAGGCDLTLKFCEDFFFWFANCYLFFCTLHSLCFMFVITYNRREVPLLVAFCTCGFLGS
jgi:hypothetical protein